MKKIIMIAVILLLSVSMPCYCFEIQKSDTAQIKTILNGYKKACRNHDINKIKTFYSPNYKNSDGFNLDELSEMLEKTYNSFDNIKYITKINSITVFDNWAIAQLTDETSAVLYPDEKKTKEKRGYLKGKSVYSVFLKKNNNNWEIVYDDTIMEESSLKYGIANKIGINLNVPAFVKQGQEYDLSLEMDKPDDIVALASISKEEIVYPPMDYDQKFRRFPSQGSLERVVKANNNNLDEYAIASIGFTKVTVNEQETRARIEVLGMAYIMKRINMENPKKIVEGI